jgi:major membrane immunogen (membrane-anchored lipoprotein)
MERRMMALYVAAAVGLIACSGSDETDSTVPAGGINGPAVVDPSFDPFATDPSAPPATGRD